jgi:hypothetical protein
MTMVPDNVLPFPAIEPTGFYLAHEVEVLSALLDLDAVMRNLALLTLLPHADTAFPDGTHLLPRLSPAQHTEMLATADEVLDLLTGLPAPIKRAVAYLRSTARTRMSSDTWRSAVRQASLVEV